MKTQYVADDGKIFETEDECKEYERKEYEKNNACNYSSSDDIVINILQRVKEFCKKQSGCLNCSLYIESAQVCFADETFPQNWVFDGGK